MNTEYVSLSDATGLGPDDGKRGGSEPIVDVKESQGRIKLTFTFPGFYMNTTKRKVKNKQLRVTHVSMAGTGFLAEDKRPMLPSVGRFVQVPASSYWAWEVTKGSSVRIDDVLVLPAQHPRMGSGGGRRTLEFDKSVYGRDAIYPSSMVQEGSQLHEINGYQALLVSVVPFQYNPRRRRLKAFSTVTVTIKLTRSAPKMGKRRKRRVATVEPRETDREAFANMLFNPNREIEGILQLTPSLPTQTPRLKGAEFLIFCHPPFKVAAEKLARWKEKRGVRTEIDEVQPGETCDSLKARVRLKQQEATRLRYLLLFGDVDTIPPQKMPRTECFDSNITDYYYSTTSDPADSSELVLPRLAVGRIPVRDLGEAIGVVDKIIEYEKSPPVDSDYFRNLTFAVYHEGKDLFGESYLRTMEAIRSRMENLGFVVERVYMAAKNCSKAYDDGTPIPADVLDTFQRFSDPADATRKLIDAATQGRLLIAHRGHGEKDGFIHPPFKLGDLDKIKGALPSVFYSINCLTGRFDLKGAKASFAEKLLTIKNWKGCPSVIASTRISHTWLNNCLIMALFDGAWGGIISSYSKKVSTRPMRYSRIGDLLNYAKVYLMAATHCEPEYVRDHFEIYHVIGDPTLEIWRAQPKELAVSGSLKGNRLSVRMVGKVPEAVLTVWRGPKPIRRRKLESGLTHVPFSGDTSGLRYYVSAPGYRFCELLPK